MPLDKVDLSKYLSDVFIETGTHRGDGVRRALEAGFEDVRTCDVDASFLGRIPANLRDDPRVMIGYGSSERWMLEFCYFAEYRSATFWLDAHPNGELSFDDCPLADELRVIMAHAPMLSGITILIDDMRLWSKDDQQRIQSCVEAIRPDAKVYRINGHCENDILVGQM